MPQSISVAFTTKNRVISIFKSNQTGEPTPETPESIQQILTFYMFLEPHLVPKSELFIVLQRVYIHTVSQSTSCKLEAEENQWCKVKSEDLRIRSTNPIQG